MKNLLLTILFLAIGIQCYANDFFAQQAEKCYVEGMEAYKNKKYNDAIDCFKRSVMYDDMTGRIFPYRGANAKDWLANSYHKIGQDSVANSLMTCYLFEPYDDALSHYADSILSLAFQYIGDGDTEHAINSFYLSSVKYKELVGDCIGYLFSIITLGMMYENMGQYSKAEPQYIESMEIRKRVLGENHPDYAASLNSLALLYYKMGQYAKAEPLLIESMEIRKRVLGENHPDYATSLNNLAALYDKTGQYAKAEPLYIESIDITKRVLGENHPDYALSLNNLASLYDETGQYARAEPLYIESTEIRKRVLGENHPDYATSLSNLALLYYNMGQSDKVESLLVESMEIIKRVLGENHPDYATSLDNLASLYYKTGQYAKAEPLLIDSTEIRKRVLGENHPDYATSLNNLASLYYNMGQYDKAEPLLIESTEIKKRVLGENHPDYAANLNNLAALYDNTNRLDKAAPLYQQSFNLNKKLLLDGFDFMSENQRNQYYGKYESEFNDIYPSFCYKYYPKNDSISCFAYDKELFIKGLLLNAGNAIKNGILESGDTAVIAKWEELASLKNHILKLQSQPLDKQTGLPELEERAEKLEKDLTRESKDYREAAENARLTYKDVHKHLGENDVAIEFVDFNDTTDVIYYALVLRKEYKYPKLVPLFNESEVDSLFAAHKRKSALYDMNFDESHQLYNLVWEKLERYVPQGSKVYYSPTGVLHKLNIGAIPVSDTERIGDKYNMVRLSSTREICKNHNNKIYKAAIYGGIDYDLDKETMAMESAKYQNTEELYSWNTRSTDIDSLYRSGVKYLPFTDKEATDIDNLLEQKLSDVTLMKADSANEESFKTLSGKKLNILHIATHGFFWYIEEANRTELFKGRMMDSNDEMQNRYNLMQDPMQRSGLLFAGANLALKGMSDSIPRGVDDGILTAKEISNIDLRGTDIAVLSACDTGGGEVSGDGVFGLQRGFKQAGVQTIVMSLWQVNDQVTKELMVQFYTNWIIKNMPKREAFNTAMKSIRDKYLEPYYWAAFVMMD